MHFDLPMDLYEKRQRKDVLETEFLPEFEAGLDRAGFKLEWSKRFLFGALGLHVARKK